MTITTTNLPSEGGKFRAWLKAAGHGLRQGFAAHMESASRIREIERMNALSDSELHAMGVKREEIPRHVFRDLFFV